MGMCGKASLSFQSEDHDVPRIEAISQVFLRARSEREVEQIPPGADPQRRCRLLLIQIEVKSTARPRLGDAAHLRTFRTEYGKKARAGLLLHTGNTIEWLAPDVLAAPWWRVL